VLNAHGLNHWLAVQTGTRQRAGRVLRILVGSWLWSCRVRYYRHGRHRRLSAREEVQLSPGPLLACRQASPQHL